MNKLKKLSILLALVIVTSGCTAIHTSVAKKQLDVQTQMSETIFLDPVSPEKRVVFVQVRNTSDKPGLSTEVAIKQAISNNGYTITDDPEQAHYWLQANVLRAGKTDDGDDSLAKGFGGAVVGGYAGNVFGDGDGKVAATVAGAIIGSIIEASVKDVYYNLITDVQISERARNGVVVTEQNEAMLQQGTSGQKTVSSLETTDWKRYQTRIVATANKVNLEYAEAEPLLVNGLVRTISGIL